MVDKVLLYFNSFAYIFKSLLSIFYKFLIFIDNIFFIIFFNKCLRLIRFTTLLAVLVSISVSKNWYGLQIEYINHKITYPFYSFKTNQQASRTPQNQPSTQQLRMLVQQIQLAVQEGYLNHQILNQPLAPQTLILLNQLLQQIKVLQQLHQQHSMQNSLKGNSQTVLQLSVQITKTKQQIANLQNQIAVQQATYMKQQQQQQQQQHPSTPSQPSDYYKPSIHDPMSALQNSFSDLAMNKEAPVVSIRMFCNEWIFIN